ncbi:hypothetical protein [Streptomyces chartreusis]|uniref:hypothetical protein n=1 Tax=Streptomyces chartreusis TaxID=1969 RepID=UPI0035DD4303
MLNLVSRSRIGMASAAAGLALATTVALAGPAQAAPISRTSSCAKFTGDYSYWKDASGWYSYLLTGTVTRTCAGTDVHGITVTGEKKGGGQHYQDRSRLLDKGETWNIIFSGDGVRDIRIALD